MISPTTQHGRAERDPPPLGMHTHNIFCESTEQLYQLNDTSTWSTPMHPRMPWLMDTKNSTPMVL